MSNSCKLGWCMPKSQVHLVGNWAILLHGPVHFVRDMIDISAERKGEGHRFGEVRSCSINGSAHNLWIYTIQFCRSQLLCGHL